MKYLGFPGGLAVFAAVFLMPAPAGLTAAGQAALACFLLALVWWVTEPRPDVRHVADADGPPRLPRREAQRRRPRGSSGSTSYGST